MVYIYIYVNNINIYDIYTRYWIYYIPYILGNILGPVPLDHKGIPELIPTALFCLQPPNSDS